MIHLLKVWKLTLKKNTIFIGSLFLFFLGSSIKCQSINNASKPQKMSEASKQITEDWKIWKGIVDSFKKRSILLKEAYSKFSPRANKPFTCWNASTTPTRLSCLEIMVFLLPSMLLTPFYIHKERAQVLRHKSNDQINNMLVSIRWVARLILTLRKNQKLNLLFISPNIIEGVSIESRTKMIISRKNSRWTRLDGRSFPTKGKWWCWLSHIEKLEVSSFSKHF